jgi:hypothetical protein
MNYDEDEVIVIDNRRWVMVAGAVLIAAVVIGGILWATSEPAWEDAYRAEVQTTITEDPDTCLGMHLLGLDGDAIAALLIAQWRGQEQEGIEAEDWERASEIAAEVVTEECGL